MEKLQILVTGANGLIGHKLCEKLLAIGHEIVALSRSKHPDLLKSMLGNTNFRLVTGDIRDVVFTKKLFRNNRFEAVFHMAVERYFPDPETAKIPDLRSLPAYQTNFEGTVNLLQNAAESGVRAWIQSSAMMVFDIEHLSDLPVSEKHTPQPVEPNGLSVFLAEEACTYFGRSKNLNYTILRYPGIFGIGKPRGIITNLREYFSTESGQMPSVATNRTGDFLSADDVVTANIFALNRLLASANPDPKSGWQRLFHIGSGREISPAEIARMMRKITGSEKPVIECESPNPRRFWFDISAARQLLNFEPTELETSLKLFINHSTISATEERQ